MPDPGSRAIAEHVVEVFYRVMSTGELDGLAEAFHGDWVQRPGGVPFRGVVV